MAEEEEEQRQRQQRGRERGQEIREFNSRQKALTEEENRIRKAQENLLLSYALAKEREAAAAEDAKKQQNRKAAADYRHYLEEQMVRDAEDTALVDEMRMMEENKAWAARDAALKARDDARLSLMHSVDRERQEQMRAKAQQIAAARAEEEAWASKFLEEAKAGMEMDKLAIAQRRTVAKQTAMQLTDQVRQRQEREEAEKQEAYLESKLAQYKERQQQKKLEALYSTNSRY